MTRKNERVEQAYIHSLDAIYQANMEQGIRWRMSTKNYKNLLLQLYNLHSAHKTEEYYVMDIKQYLKATIENAIKNEKLEITREDFLDGIWSVYEKREQTKEKPKQRMKR